jgi:hypothetical protein
MSLIEAAKKALEDLEEANDFMDCERSCRPYSTDALRAAIEEAERTCDECGAIDGHKRHCTSNTNRQVVLPAEAIRAAHAAGFAGTSWIMGPEELAHLPNVAQMMSDDGLCPDD